MTKSPGLDDLTIDLGAAISGGATVAMSDDYKGETAGTTPPYPADPKLTEKWAKFIKERDDKAPDLGDILRDPSESALNDGADALEQQAHELLGAPTNRDRFRGGVNQALDKVAQVERPTTLEGMIERYSGQEIDFGSHLDVLEKILQKHTLNEWAVRCWSGMKHYEDPHRRLVEMLKTREWALRELAAVEAEMDGLHLIDKRSPAASLRLLLKNPPVVVQGMNQLNQLMDRYGDMAGEQPKHKRLPFFARASLFIKKALGLNPGMRHDESKLPPPVPSAEDQLTAIQADYVEPQLTAADRYQRLLDGWVDVDSLESEPEYDFSGDDMGMDLINEQLREFRQKLGIPDDE